MVSVLVEPASMLQESTDKIDQKGVDVMKVGKRDLMWLLLHTWSTD